MNLCSENHEEVCYEGKNCPACVKHDEMIAAEGMIEDRDATIKTLEDEVASLKQQLRESQ